MFEIIIGVLCKETITFIIHCYEEIWKQTTIILEELHSLRINFKKKEQEKEQNNRILMQSVQEIRIEMIHLKQKNKILEEVLYRIHSTLNQLLENQKEEDNKKNQTIMNEDIHNTNISSSSLLHTLLYPVFQQTLNIHNNNCNNNNNDHNYQKNETFQKSSPPLSTHEEIIRFQTKKIPYQANFYVKDKTFINFISGEIMTMMKNKNDVKIRMVSDFILNHNFDGIIIVRHHLDHYLMQCNKGLDCTDIKFGNCRYIHGKDFDYYLICFKDPFNLLKNETTGFITDKTDIWQKLDYFVLDENILTTTIISFEKLSQFMSTRIDSIINFAGNKNIFVQK